MTSGPARTNVAEREAAFWDEERENTPVPVRVACVLGIAAFASFHFLDPLVTDDVQNLFIARSTIVGVHLAIILWSFTDLAKRHFRVLALLPCFAIGLGVVAVTQLAGGGESRYHEALLLTYFAYPLVVPARPVSAGAAFALVTLSYGIVMLATGVTGPTEVWATNNSILWVGTAIATGGVGLMYRQRRRAFNARLDLAAARAEREQWLENLARFLRHELKNQVTATETSVKLAGTGSTSPERSQRYLDRATRSLQRMRKLVESATEATSLEAALSAGELAPVDLATLVAERGQAFREAHPDKKFELLLPSSLVVRGSEVRLEQLIDKLLSNAVEHTADGRIGVALKDDGDAASLTIENEGDALPDDKHIIFDPYFTTGGEADNSGLGLYVVKVIAEGHGGSARAYDLPRGGASANLVDGEGAGFEVRLPVSRDN